MILKKSINGFTFLEVMVALAVLALILTAVFRLYAQSILMITSSDFDMKAPFLAQKIVTEFKTDSKINMGENGRFEDELKDFTWNIKKEELFLSGYTDLLPEEIENIKINKIIVTISKNSKEFQTFFYEKADD
ncbi:MAG: prepilin-type N-terminal cleavage/methylation domain-containing protein [Desulforegulaceae bacterium]|nr:prepilin-type N-terminal cleavage/methylation domain-containing protein [Desulforegulaceae bacterium]